MQANLEYLDGSEANADSGMFLRHAQIFDLLGVDKTTCKNRIPALFATGNERSAADICVEGFVPSFFVEGDR
jgi:hypothetical protein